MQDEVEAFLGDASTFGAPVTRVDTHAAVVFLVGDQALKIKRAVRLPFLDFSTLERRKAGCEAELAVNRPLAPSIYRRVVPITREPDGRLAINGTGDVVEWALEMRRFDESQTLDRLAERGALTEAVAADAADAIAAAHRDAAVVTRSGWVESIPAIVRQNADAFRAGKIFQAEAFHAFERLAMDAYAAHRSCIEHRSKDGFVRRCHGDLHLANLALIDGKPVLFDAIEFDERLATIDVLHDLAFTLMDLVRYGCIGAANGMLNRYLELTSRGNLAALRLLPLFMSLRAAVRANVLSLRTARNDGDRARLETAMTYLSLAQSVLAPAPPMLIAIGGLSGTGKSAVARTLAPSLGTRPGAIVLRSDTTRKRMLGSDPLERLPASAYRPDVTAGVYARLAVEADTIVRQGHAVIVDAVFAREDERTAIERVARQAQVPFVGLFLTADLAIRLARIAQRTADASDATAEVAREQESYQLDDLGWETVDAAGTLTDVTGRCTVLLHRKGLRAGQQDTR